jgi:AraC-like DNA-binding protein/mannose-6-phosphate isomerase-like protein (cupin superfamily)
MSSQSPDANLRKAPAEVELPEGEVLIVESHHAAEFTMTMDAWPFHKIVWVAIGSGRLEYSGGKRELGRDDFVLLPAHWAHRFVDNPREPLTLVLFCISTRFIESEVNPERAEIWAKIAKKAWIGQPLRARTAFHQTALLERFRRALREQSIRSAGWKTALRGLADAILIRFARDHLAPKASQSGTKSRESVQGAIEHIDSHPHEPQRIADMAAKCQLSERRFTQLFKQETGTTFSAYLNQRRIQYACERLRETGHILYACHESGFNDPAYFYRVFKKQTGRTPGEFIRALG